MNSVSYISFSLGKNEVYVSQSFKIFLLLSPNISCEKKMQERFEPGCLESFLTAKI